MKPPKSLMRLSPSGKSNFSQMKRREFLAGSVAATGAAWILADGTESLPAQSRRKGLIDIHHHLIAPDYRKAAEAAGYGTLPRLSPELSIAEMDKNGITLGMLSLASPGLWFGNREQSR